MSEFSWSKVNWKTRAKVGSVVMFLFDDTDRRVKTGDLGLVVWDAGFNPENGCPHAGRDVLTQDGRTVNIPHYELKAAGHLARYFTLPTR